MFKFLKDKLKNTIKRISKTIDVEATTISEEEPKLIVEIKREPTTEELLKELEERPIEEPEEEEEKTVEELRAEEEITKEVEEELKGIEEAEKEIELAKEAEEPLKEKLLIEEEIEPIEQKEKIEEEPKRSSFFSKIKEKLMHEEEPSPLEGFEELTVKTELEEQKEAAARREAEEEKRLAEKKIKEKLEKKEIPTIQELAKRKEEPEEKIKKLKEELEEIKEEIAEEKKEPEEEEIEKTKEKLAELKEEVIEEEKKGFFGKLREKITTKKINEKQFEDLFWNLEIALLENNVAVEVIGKIKGDLKKDLVDKPIKRTQIERTIVSSLKNSIEDVLKMESFDLVGKIKQKKPFIICFVGINGSGKTTTIAKIARLLQNNKLSVVLAASDTFRAASIEQLQKHADNLGVKLVKHSYGSDPAAVAYDAIEHAKAQKIDAVLIDTAGRMHSNTNLMDELKKVTRVAKPDLVLFVGESITGNDCVEQAKTFNDVVRIDAIILAKADIDEKGGAAVSVSYVTKKPIIYLGIGQNYEDLQKFDSGVILKNLGLAA